MGLPQVILGYMPAQVAFSIDPIATSGLRERKKAKTRLAIEDAALTLFEERGFDATTVDEIAALAEVSTTTFFRYFPTKADVLLSDHGIQLPALRQAIVDRPRSESDLVAIWQAVQTEWVADVDTERTARKARIVATSDLLTGLSYHSGERWLAVFVGALAQRNEIDPSDERCSLAARVGLGALASAVEGWIAEGCDGSLRQRVDVSFDRMRETCGRVVGISIGRGKDPMMTLKFRDLTQPLGAEVIGFDPRIPLGDGARRTLRSVFDCRGLLLLRDVGLTHAQQVNLCQMLIRNDGEDELNQQPIDDNFYVSNRRPNSAAPYGRLQFHSDTMWADRPMEVLSLYGVEVEEPAVPTTFVSATHGWAIIPDWLRIRCEGLSAIHIAGQVQRGDPTDVLLSSFENPPSTTQRIAWTHPRTGRTILYVCEQMTKEIVGLEPNESERLLEQLFTYLYDPAAQWHHNWRAGDLVVWDNLAIQHPRQNVGIDGPSRTLRKVARPMIQLSKDQMPSYRATS